MLLDGASVESIAGGLSRGLAVSGGVMRHPRGRDERRSHREALVEHWLRVLWRGHDPNRLPHAYVLSSGEETNDPGVAYGLWARMYARTPKSCNGPCCANPRRLTGELRYRDQRQYPAPD